MARQRNRKSTGGAKSAETSDKPSEPARREYEQEVSEDENEAIMEKDEDEDELDKMVLGDSAGFLEQLGKDDEDELASESEADLEAELGLGGEGEGMEGVDDADLFFLDAGPADPSSNASIPRPESESGESVGDGPVWEDSDDDRLVISLASHSRLRKLRVTEAEDLVSGREYTKRLRRQFQRLNPAPEWASTERPAKRRRRSSASSSSSIRSDNDVDMDMDDEDLSALPLAKIMQNAGSLQKLSDSRKTTKLRPEVVNIQRTRDISTVQPSAINSLSFHPQYPVLLSSGPASTLYMHHISPEALPTPHPLLTSVHITKTPLWNSAFLGPTGDKVIFAGRRRYFHIWDLPSGNIQKVTQILGHKAETKTMERLKLSPCGKYIAVVGSSIKGGGTVNVLDAATTQWIASARIEGRNGVADFVWWSDGQGLTIASKSGEIGEWDLASRSFVGFWNDEGAAGTTCICLGGKSGSSELGGDRWIVVGSQSGVVNIYDRRPWVENGVQLPLRPEPAKRFMQLTTPTSCMEISSDGQLLVFASRWKKNALKLVHLPSYTVFRNWPTQQTPFGRISALAFNKEGTGLAVGNEQGKIKMWEIRP